MHWIVIPFRGPEAAKSRLAGALSDADRRALALAMFRHVLDVAIACVGRERVLVVTPCAGVAATVSNDGVAVLREASGSLNGALALACDELRERGADRVTIVAADLPLLTVSDLSALMAAAGGGIAIAPDRAGGGTNALSLPLAVRLDLAYGPGSLEAHRSAARRLGLEVALVARPGLASDIDIEADLALLRGGGWPGTGPGTGPGLGVGPDPGAGAVRRGAA